MPSLARRLRWLNLFTRLERWNEEILLVDEEMRRVAEWYRFYINIADEKAASFSNMSIDRQDRGYNALLAKNAMHLRQDFRELPDLIKRRTVIPDRES